VKCKYPDTSDPKLENPLKCYADTADNCIARFLEKEIAIFRPRIIFCFGKKVSDELLWKRIQQPGKLSGVQFNKVVLVHPAASDRHPPKYPSFAEVVQENDRRISKVLAK
jgi:uracil-DNA glycosylase